MKKRLTQTEEFEILKLVIDKILILGTFFLGFGLWDLLSRQNYFVGSLFIFSGAVLMFLFIVLMYKEYEIK